MLRTEEKKMASFSLTNRRAAPVLLGLKCAMRVQIIGRVRFQNKGLKGVWVKNLLFANLHHNSIYVKSKIKKLSYVWSCIKSLMLTKIMKFAPKIFCRFIDGKTHFNLYFNVPPFATLIDFAFLHH